LVPGHPSWLAPLGSWDQLAKAGLEGASLRWGSLNGGPLRLAVLANDGQDQIDEATRIADRWVVRSPSPRACSPAESVPAAKAGTLSVTIASPGPLAPALVGPRVGWRRPCRGRDGWRRRATTPPGRADAGGDS